MTDHVHSTIAVNKETLMTLLLRCQSPFSSITIIGFDFVDGVKVVHVISKNIDSVHRMLKAIGSEFGYTSENGNYVFIEDQR